jgi:hypothetical protein
VVTTFPKKHAFLPYFKTGKAGREFRNPVLGTSKKQRFINQLLNLEFVLSVVKSLFAMFANPMSGSV